MRDRIALVGFRGTGKSVVGRLLSEHLGWPWRDSDRELERQTGRTIADCLREWGEPGFREREQQVIEQLWDPTPCVLSLGGGAVLGVRTRERLPREAWVIWLRARPETIQQRLASDPCTPTSRPPLTSCSWEEEIQQLLAAREPLYTQVSHCQYDTDQMRPEEIAIDVYQRLLAGGQFPNDSSARP